MQKMLYKTKKCVISIDIITNIIKIGAASSGFLLKDKKCKNTIYKI